MVELTERGLHVGPLDVPFLRTRLQVVALPISIVAALVAGLVAANRSGAVALGLFVAFQVGWLVQRAVPDLIEEDHPGSRTVYFMLRPAAATAVLLGAWGLWRSWWLSLVLGLVAGSVLHLLLGWLLVPDIVVEEVLDELDRSGVDQVLAHEEAMLHGGLDGEGPTPAQPST